MRIASTMASASAGVTHPLTRWGKNVEISGDAVTHFVSCRGCGPLPELSCKDAF